MKKQINIVICRNGQANPLSNGEIDSYRRLTMIGADNLKLTAEALKDIEFNLVLSSPALRALDTAYIIAFYLNAELVPEFYSQDERLTKVIKELTNSSLEKYFEHPLSQIIHTIGEMASEAAREKIEDEIFLYPDEKEVNILIIGHGAILMATAYYLCENAENKRLLLTQKLEEGRYMKITEYLDL